MTRKISCVAFDLDGTLLGSQGTVSPNTRHTIANLQDKGCLCTIATGRMFASAAPIARDLKMYTIPIITYNGSLIQGLQSTEPLFSQGISQEIAEEILTFCKKRGWYVQSYVADRLLVEEKTEWTYFYEKIAGVEAFPQGKNFFTPPGEPLKILLAADNDIQYRTIYETLEHTFGHKVFLAGSHTPGARFIEIVSPRVNKGQALLKLCDMAHIAPEETLVFGDSENDLPLFHHAACSVAMGNGAPKVQESAAYVTATNDEDGISRFFQAPPEELIFPRS